jgi:hypothetical protein
MRHLSAGLVAAGLLAAGLLGSGAGAAPSKWATAQLPGTGAECPLFPADNVWHADVSQLPVHPRSAAWITSMGGPERRLHPDFGPNGGGQPYGIPYSVVPGSTEKVAVTFDYADESDPGPYPFGPTTPIEGGSDAHALIVDKDRCVLYELFAADWNGGRPAAGSGAIWDLRSNALRPRGWTSADAAGLPILPGLLRRDEVAAGTVDHAIRLTASRTDRSFLWPARHHAGAANDPSLPPMGAWFRLKASFDVSAYRADTQVVLRAMQRHGLIVADNGSNWYFTGTSEPGWDTGLLDQLKAIPAGAFEAVDTSSLMADTDSGRVATSATPPATTLPTATTTTRPGATTTTRPRATTTTRPRATPATLPPTAATTATTSPEASSTTTAPAPESTATTAAPEVAAPASGPPVNDAGPPPQRPSRRWWLGILVALGLATGIAWRKKWARKAKVED